MKNGWTAGQYTLFRILFGAYLTAHFVQLLPWGAEVFSHRGVLPDAGSSPLVHVFPNVLASLDSPAFVTAFLALGALLAVCFAMGWRDRPAAIGLWYVWTCLLGRNPLISNPSIPYVGWLLLAHACLSGPRFGAWVRRGRSEGGDVWRMPALLFGAAWALMALGYSYSGFTKLLSPSWADGTALGKMLSNPLGRPGPVHGILLALPPVFLKIATWGALGVELLFAPLALSRRLRPWLWGLLMGMHLVLMVAIDFADLSLGMVMLHLFTLDPAWIRPRRAAAADVVLYDGACGLCHGFVRFVLSEDVPGDSFRFAPLGAPAAGTIVVRTAGGEVLTRSRAVLRVLDRMGGLWRLSAMAGGLLPPKLTDALYDAVARVRHRLFAAPDGACPMLPPALRARFR